VNTTRRLSQKSQTNIDGSKSQAISRLHSSRNQFQGKDKREPEAMFRLHMNSWLVQNQKTNLGQGIWWCVLLDNWLKIEGCAFYAAWFTNSE
jgi:hypothetical protein